jgi:hypothetical protein
MKIFGAKLAHDYSAILQLFRVHNREVISRHSDPCPECGLCNPEWKASCLHKDWCPNYRR